MKGIILNLLQTVTEQEHGEQLWDEVLTETGLVGAYTALGNYPDAEVVALVTAIGGHTRQDPGAVLQWFGRHAMPHLARRYPSFFAPSDPVTFVTTLHDVIHSEVHEAMRNLAAAATHDIKNPLASIVGFVEMLQGDALDDGARAEVRNRLAAATHYTHSLIDGLLDVLGAGVHDEPPAAVDLAEVLDEIGANLRARHPQARLDHRVHGQVVGHRVDIRRLFDNLVENAVRYASHDDVTISIDPVPGAGGVLVVRVGDDGPGVLAEDRDRIFGIFQRGRGQPQRAGTGVGLAVAQRIARAVHGDVWLDAAPAPDGGAAFMVRLPRAD